MGGGRYDAALLWEPGCAARRLAPRSGIGRAGPRWACLRISSLSFGKAGRPRAWKGLGRRGWCELSLVSPQFLAMVFQDLLTNKDDYLRASRALLREIIKQTKHEINFQAFCLGLMQERKEPQYLDMEFKVGARPCSSCAVCVHSA